MLRAKRRTAVPAVSLKAFPEGSLWTSCNRFLEWTIAVGLSPETERIRRSALERFANWCGRQAATEVGDITHSVLEGYQHHLATSRKRSGQLLAPGTQAARFNPVIAYCRWLARQKLVEVDPSSRLVLPRQVRRLPARVPSVLEVDEMLRRPDVSTFAGIRDRAILEVFYSTGLRRMELARLRLRDVNLESRSVFVRWGKGRRDRVAPLTRSAVHWLRRYLEEVRFRLVGEPSDETLFLTDYGEPFTKNRLGDAVKRHVVNSGFPAPGACHLFRHACATHMLDNGADIRHIQALLGHADLSTTQIYTHVSIAKLREVHAATHPGERRA